MEEGSVVAHLRCVLRTFNDMTQNLARLHLKNVTLNVTRSTAQEKVARAVMR